MVFSWAEFISDPKTKEFNQYLKHHQEAGRNQNWVPTILMKRQNL